MEFASLVINPIVTSLIVPVKRHIDFFVSASDRVRDMHSKLRELSRAAHAVDTKHKANNLNSLVVPDFVPEWLQEVEKVKAMGNSIPIDRVGCCNIKTRYKVGKQSFDIIKDIERLMNEKAEMVWTNEQIPLAVVSPPRPLASTTVLDDDQNQNKNNIKSRDLIFNLALKSLEPNGSNNQKIALCGMGGVGKTTMMEQLKETAKNRKLFDLIVKIDVGKNSNLVAIQDVVSEYIGRVLTETNKDIRAQRLQKRFKEISEDGEKKILIILDNVWEDFNLKDIGLTSPLPVGFKLLITSREETVCTQMGVEANSIFKINVLEESEAKTLLWEIAGLASDNDSEHELHQIGEEIVKGCGGLPIAIKTIASTLRGNKEKFAWKHTLFCLRNKEFNVHVVFKISYENLKNDYERSVFLLSGLLPDDCNVGIEELLRYGWGLNLFKNVNTLVEARNCVNTCVYNLIRSNLLIKSDYDGCVKIHDLVRDFVLSNFSEVKQASIVNRDYNVFEQLKEDELYERILILIKCGGKIEFPENFNHPNLALLMLMGVNKYLKFPENFYTRMDKLKVVAYENMYLPLLPRYLTNLRSLSLRSCMLVDGDVSFLGELINLEILSLAHCGIQKLPSKIGKLKRLKLLDLSGCVELCIEDGVFENLEKLEELYMSAFKCYDGEGHAIRFTNANRNELNMLLRKLSAFEVEYFENITQQKYVSFEKLERFRISMGCPLRRNTNRYSFKNTLELVTNSKELLECNIDKLFSKTEVLHLEVNDMNYLEDVSTYHAQRKSSFFNLKELRVSNCTSLTFLFTTDMTKGLPKLEILEIKSCPALESIVLAEHSGAEVIKFDKLKLLYLKDLPELVCLCNSLNVMELPQLLELHLDQLQRFTSIFPENNANISTEQLFLNTEVKIPKLKKLQIKKMNNLKEIWPYEEVTNIAMLRSIIVGECNSLVNLFPSNLMRLLCTLEELLIDNCGSLKVLFNLDMGKVQHIDSNHSCLRVIEVEVCESLTHVWNITDAENNFCGPTIRGYEAVDQIRITSCDSFRNIVTPTTVTFDMGALNIICIVECQEYDERSNGLVMNKQQQELFQVPVDSWSLHQCSREIYLAGCDALPIVIPYYAAERMQKLQVLSIEVCSSVREIFETKEINNDNITSIDSGSDVIPRPRYITMHELSNLKILKIKCCACLEYIFTFSTFESLKKLEKLTIADCEAMKVIVREDYKEQPSTSSSKDVVFPHLRSIKLCRLQNLAGFFLGTNIDFQWPLLDYVMINDCPQMVAFTSSKSTAPRLKYIHTKLGKHNLECGLNFHVTLTPHQALSPGLNDTISQGRTWSFHNLIHCNLNCSYDDTKTFPSNVLQQLQKLETIRTARCRGVEEVFEVAFEVTNNESQTVVRFPKLREVNLYALDRLKYIWKSNPWRILEFSNLTKLTIETCSILEHVFTCSMVGSLMQLEELHIKECYKMKVVVKEEEDCDGKVSGIRFPCLKSLTLENLWSLEGFCLAKEDLTLPLLDTLEIIECPRITVFSEGRSVVPKLTIVETSKGSFNIEEDINSFIMTTQQEGVVFGKLMPWM